MIQDLNPKDYLVILAALVAAVASLSSVVLNMFLSRASERKNSHRKLLECYFFQLSESLHSILACTDTVVRRLDQNMSIESWREKGTKSGKELKFIIPKVRYLLWGVERGIRDLVRLMGWSLHVQIVPNGSRQLLKRGDSLRKAIDSAILSSYTSGKPPSALHRLNVRYKSWCLRKKYYELMNMNLEDIDNKATLEVNEKL